MTQLIAVSTPAARLSGGAGRRGCWQRAQPPWLSAACLCHRSALRDRCPLRAIRALLTHEDVLFDKSSCFCVRLGEGELGEALPRHCHLWQLVPVQETGQREEMRSWERMGQASGWVTDMRRRQCLCALPSAHPVPFWAHSSPAAQGCGCWPEGAILHPLPAPGRPPVTSTLPAMAKGAHGRWEPDFPHSPRRPGNGAIGVLEIRSHCCRSDALWHS